MLGKRPIISSPVTVLCPITFISPDSNVTVTKPSCSDNVLAARRPKDIASASDSPSCVDSGMGPHFGIAIVARLYIIGLHYEARMIERMSDNITKLPLSNRYS